MSMELKRSKVLFSWFDVLPEDIVIKIYKFARMEIIQMLPQEIWWFHCQKHAIIARIPLMIVPYRNYSMFKCMLNIVWRLIRSNSNVAHTNPELHIRRAYKYYLSKLIDVIERNTHFLKNRFHRDDLLLSIHQLQKIYALPYMTTLLCDKHRVDALGKNAG